MLQTTIHLSFAISSACLHNLLKGLLALDVGRLINSDCYSAITHNSAEGIKFIATASQNRDRGILRSWQFIRKVDY